MDPKFVVLVYTVGWAGAVVNLLGLVGNIFSLMVLVSKEFRKANSNLYLTALSIYDSFFLAVAFCIVCLDWIVYGLNPLSLFTLSFTMPAGVVLDPLIQVLITGSVYTTMALTWDRCIAVTKPLKWPSICTRGRVKIVLLLVFLVSVVLNVPFMFEVRYKQEFIPELNSSFLLGVGTDYSHSWFHTEVYLEYCIPIFTLVIPIGGILLPNLVIVLALRRQQSNMKSSRSSSGRTGRPNRLTAQVLFISMFTLVSRLFHGVTYIMMDDRVYITDCSFSCACVSACSALLVHINAAINFVCYCLFGEKFRSAFLLRVGSCCRFGRGKEHRRQSHMQRVFSVDGQTATTNMTELTTTATTSTAPTTDSESKNKEATN